MDSVGVDEPSLFGRTSCDAALKFRYFQLTSDVLVAPEIAAWNFSIGQC